MPGRWLYVGETAGLECCSISDGPGVAVVLQGQTKGKDVSQRSRDAREEEMRTRFREERKRALF